MFTSLQQSWNNVCSDSASVKVCVHGNCLSLEDLQLSMRPFPVQELIPELFYLPEMLTNHNKVNIYIKIGPQKTAVQESLPPTSWCACVHVCCVV